MTLEVTKKIQHMIVTMRLKPGEVFREKDICAQLKVGRTPVREAVLILKTRGLLNSSPNGLTYVTEITLKSVKDLFVTYLMIEKQILIQAIQRMTPEAYDLITEAFELVEKSIAEDKPWDVVVNNHHFHTVIASVTDNELLISIYEMILTRAERISYLSTNEDIIAGVDHKKHLSLVSDDHKEIMKVLKGGTPQDAEDIAEKHIGRLHQRVLNYLQSF